MRPQYHSAYLLFSSVELGNIKFFRLVMKTCETQ
jgi:hypothetical protein